MKRLHSSSSSSKSSQPLPGSKQPAPQSVTRGVPALRLAAERLPSLNELFGPGWQNLWRLPGSHPQVFQAGRWTFDAGARTLRWGSCVKCLLPAESGILMLLLQNAGNTVAHPALYARGWPGQQLPGPDEYGSMVSRVIDRLRQALGPPEAKYLQSVPGDGYRWHRP